MMVMTSVIDLLSGSASATMMAGPRMRVRGRRVLLVVVVAALVGVGVSARREEAAAAAAVRAAAAAREETQQQREREGGGKDAGSAAGGGAMGDEAEGAYGYRQRFPEEQITKLAFGSCNHQDLPQPLWPVIHRERADAFIAMGDAVYSPDNSLQALHHSLVAQAAQSEFSRFRESVRFLGVYDDHDYGVNDAGSGLEDRQARQDAFLDFLGEPRNSTRRRQRGLYASYTFGMPPRQVKVILLDTRYHRDYHIVPSLAEWRLPLTAAAAAFVRLATAVLGIGTRYDGDMLGEQQWQWLRSELEDSHASVTVLVSSVQILTSNPMIESWGHFPMARERLLRLIRDTNPRGLVLLSGDVHFGEVLRANVTHSDGSMSELLEMTSSGLTHTCEDSLLYGWLCPVLNNAFKEHRREPDAWYAGLNYGMIEIDWQEKGGGCSRKPRWWRCEERPAVIEVSIRDAEGDPVLHSKLRATATGANATRNAHERSGSGNAASDNTQDGTGAAKNAGAARAAAGRSVAGTTITSITVAKFPVIRFKLFIYVAVAATVVVGCVALWQWSMAPPQIHPRHRDEASGPNIPTKRASGLNADASAGPNKSGSLGPRRRLSSKHTGQLHQSGATISTPRASTSVASAPSTKSAISTPSDSDMDDDMMIEDDDDDEEVDNVHDTHIERLVDRSTRSTGSGSGNRSRTSAHHRTPNMSNSSSTASHPPSSLSSSRSRSSGGSRRRRA